MNFETTPDVLAARIDALPDKLPILIRAAGSVANKKGFAPYLVGGIVRDLLLGLPHLDVDIVIEGHAASVARAMASRFGGHVQAHDRFGTALWTLADSSFAGSVVTAVDFITARRETYAHPAALPQVEPSAIGDDLRRRDFTINTLAIHLNEARFGELLDPLGGVADLRTSALRVLHDRSFVDDPTRILRAVRYEQRFDFRIEPHSASLVADALDVISLVSGARLANELLLICAERVPEKALRRLTELRVLPAIHPELRADDTLAQRFSALRAALGVPQPLAYLGAWSLQLTLESALSFAHRLRLTKAQTEFIAQLHRLRQLELQLAVSGLAASRITRLLDEFGDEALQVASALTDDALVRERIAQYRAQWRDVKPLTDGERLQAMGIRPGPVYRQILEALRDARLDGALASQAEEEQMAFQIAQSEI